MFLIRTQFRRPWSLGDDEFARMLAAEARQSKALQEAGIIRHLWREPSTSIAWGVWQAASEAEVRAKLSSLPASHAMEVEIREVIVHPNAIKRSEERPVEDHP